MHLIVDNQNLETMVKNFERGILNDTYTEKEKILLIKFMVEKAKYISGKFGRVYNFDLENKFIKKESSKNILEPDFKNIKITKNDKSFSVRTEDFFKYISVAVLNDKRSIITNLMEKENKEDFEHTLKLINNTKN